MMYSRPIGDQLCALLSKNSLPSLKVSGSIVQILSRSIQESGSSEFGRLIAETALPAFLSFLVAVQPSR